MPTITLRIGMACWMAACSGSLAQAAPAPEDELAVIFKMLVAKNASNDWSAVEKIPEADGRRCRRSHCKTACRMERASRARERWLWADGIWS